MSTGAKSAIEPIYPLVGHRIQMARESQGLSQATLGNRLSPTLTRAAIANIESGKQRLLVHHLIGISAALRVPIAKLLPPTEPQPSESAASMTSVEADLSRHLPADTVARVLARFAPESEASHEPSVRQKRSRETRRGRRLPAD